MIERTDVTKQYNNTPVLKNVTLKIDKPWIYVLLGRNGAGKTTLLKSIAGYQNITDGKILGTSKIAFSHGNDTWLLAVMTPFLFVLYDDTTLMHLGTSKKDYFIGSLAAYGLLAFMTSLANTIIHVLIDPLNQTQTVIKMMDLCDWTANGVFVAFLQQTLFLLLTMIFLHVVLSMQPYWYGWLTDGVLVAIICIFTPIAPCGISWQDVSRSSCLTAMTCCISASACR